MLLYTNLMYFNNTLSHLGKEVELLMALHNWLHILSFSPIWVLSC
jgi:hypothetical protein